MHYLSVQYSMYGEDKRAKVIELIEDIYGDAGMAVVNLLMDYMSDADWCNLYARLERVGEFINEGCHV